ncbi:MAG: aminotransferase class III-fold pyridoxal phosphate-dependent enzyme, partial [Reyranella sp.]
RRHATDLAVVILEPMIGSGGCIAAEPAFLSMLREETTNAGALLILDEVMTSRLAPGGLQSVRGVKPDLTTFGKYIGGGMSFGAFGGRRDIMELFDPTKPDHLPHAGTFNNNALTMAAGAAGNGELYTPAAAKELNERGAKIRTRLNAICAREKVAFQFSGIGSMMTAHATARPIKTAADIASGSQDAKELFYFDMMAAGIWIARRGFVALNIMIGEAEGDRFVAAVEEFVTARKALLQRQ